MATADPKPLTRRQIEEIVGNNPELVRRLERLFLVAGELTPTQIEQIFAKLEELESLPSSAPRRSLDLDYLEFDKNPAYAGRTGQLAWNKNDDTLNLHHSDGVTQQVGQELYGRITNTTGAVIPNGAVVGVNPSTASYILFTANGAVNPVTVVGIATQEIPIGGRGRVTVWGQVRDIDTTGAPYGETWLAGQVLYVSPTTAGGLTNIKPTAPNLSIPTAQVLIVSATGGAIAVRPTIEQQLFYGAFIKTNDQAIGAANTATPITMTGTVVSNGVSIGVPASRIVCANAGLYQFSCSFKVDSSGIGAKTVYFWFRKNGVDLPNSAIALTLDATSDIANTSRSIFVSMAAGDYIELYWASNSVNVVLDSLPATAFSPAAPCVALAVNQEQQ